MKPTHYMIAGLTGVIITTGLVAGLASAAEGEDQHRRHHQPPAEVVTALENNDYDAWVTATADKPIAEIITADNFDTLVEIHALRQAGDKESAKALAEELGLPEFRAEQRSERQAERQERRADVKAALDAGDYDAWLALSADKPIAEVINQNNFDQLLEMHALIQAGDKDSAKAIAEELGLPERPHHPHRGGEGGERQGPPAQQS